ncbi:MAG: hypothetical protein MHPSP_001874 [Paramarteilia canceri]
MRIASYAEEEANDSEEGGLELRMQSEIVESRSLQSVLDSGNGRRNNSLSRYSSEEPTMNSLQMLVGRPNSSNYEISELEDFYLRNSHARTFIQRWTQGSRSQSSLRGGRRGDSRPRNQSSERRLEQNSGEITETQASLRGMLRSRLPDVFDQFMNESVNSQIYNDDTAGSDSSQNDEGSNLTGSVAQTDDDTVVNTLIRYNSSQSRNRQQLSNNDSMFRSKPDNSKLTYLNNIYSDKFLEKIQLPTCLDENQKGYSLVINEDGYTVSFECKYFYNLPNLF